MISFKKVDDLEKLLREEISVQSELPLDRVLNSLSLYGTELDTYLMENIYVSIEQPDTLVLFELTSRKSNSDVSMNIQTEDDFITYDKAFRLNLIMYGSSSSDVALKLVARFRTEEVRNNLYEKGIYLEKVEDPYILNEYKNETMWLRNDVNIDIAVEFKIQPITKNSIFSNLSELNIKEEEK